MGIHAYVPAFGLNEIIPFLTLLVGAIGCLIADAATPKEGSRRLLPIIAAVSIIASMAMFYADSLPRLPFLEKTFAADQFGQVGCLVILFAMLAQTAMAPSLIERRNLPSGEYYTLILFAALGAVILATANELLTAFVALEVMSLSLYVLAGIDRRSGKAQEAAFKYFILGSFASAFLVLGMAFLFGATKTTYISDMAEIFKAGGTVIAEAKVREGALFASQAVLQPLNPLWVFMGFGLVFVGLCFKLSLAPFHMWAPDVYQGANSPAALVIATASKVATLAFAVHLIEAMSMWPTFASAAGFIVAMVAVASILWGNLAGLVQSDFKRMLAFSSVAHTGYTAIGLYVLVMLPTLGLDPDTLATARAGLKNAMIFYMAAYTAMNALAFGIGHHVAGDHSMAAYRGLVSRQPLAAAGMALAMFSLLGIPPTVGFMGKFYLFQEAVKYGFTGIAVVGVLGSVISAFYYLGLVVTMFMRSEDEAGSEKIALAGTSMGEALAFDRVAILASALIVIVFGLVPGLFFGLKLAATPGGLF